MIGRCDHAGLVLLAEERERGIDGAQRKGGLKVIVFKCCSRITVKKKKKQDKRRKKGLKQVNLAATPETSWPTCPKPPLRHREHALHCSRFKVVLRVGKEGR